jgi:septation ring formation regulator EzrA
MKIEYFIREIENLKKEIEELKKTIGLVLLTLDNHNNIFSIVNQMFQQYEIALANLLSKVEELEEKIFNFQNR